jgi:hypothetical protein
MGGMLTLRGEVVAFVGATRWYLVPPLDELPDDDRERCAVVALCRALVNDAAVVRFDPPHPPPE